MMDFADLDVALELRLPAIDGELVRGAMDTARAERWVERLHDRDTSLWSPDERVQAEIAKWLGWDPTLVRLGYVVLTVISVGFPGILMYILLWILMPQEPAYPGAA